MKPHTLSALLLSLTLLCSCKQKTQTELLLEKLDQTLANSAEYESYFLQRVAVLKELRSKADSDEYLYDVNRKLGDEYAYYCMDSSTVYYSENIALAEKMGSGNPYRKIESQLLLAKEYLKGGYYSECEGILKSIPRDKVPEALVFQYFSVYHSLNGEMMTYTKGQQAHDAFRKIHQQLRDSCLKYTPKNTFSWYELKAEEASGEGNKVKMKLCIDQMLSCCEVNSKQYAAALYQYQFCLQSDDPALEEALIRSAIADVMNATKDYASLSDLSKMLYEQGDIDRAFHYVADFAMQDAISFGSKLRPWLIARFFPNLEQAYIQKDMRQKRFMVTLIAALGLVLLMLLFAVLLVKKRQSTLQKTKAKLEKSHEQIEAKNEELSSMLSKFQQLNLRLKESEKVKQEYIIQFLSILSDDISQQRQYKNHVLKYIRMGNAQYIAEEVEQMPPVGNDVQKFYGMFDKAFINIYPDFVEDFSALLSDPKPVLPKDDDLLSPELRIFALIKMGISDSTRIASLLHYSANTIYNYRAKVRNLAKGDRSTFEDRVREL